MAGADDDASREYVEDVEMGDLREPPTETTPDDKTRRWVTYALVLLLAVLALGGLSIAAAGVMDPSVESDVLDKVFNPVVALTSTAVGFYFGENRRRHK